MKYSIVLIAVLVLVVHQAVATNVLLEQMTRLENRLTALESNAPACGGGCNRAAVPPRPNAAALANQMVIKPTPKPLSGRQPMKPEELNQVLEQVKVLLSGSKDGVPPALLQRMENLSNRVKNLSEQLYHFMNPDAEVPWQQKQAEMFKKPGNPLIGDHAGMRAKTAERLMKVFKYTQNIRKISKAEVENMLGGHPDVKNEN